MAAKPTAHPVHHLPIVLPLLILAAAGLAAVGSARRPAAWRIAGVIAGAAALLWLGGATRDGLFFFSRSDTRRIAATWAADSVPANVAIGITPYTVERRFLPPDERKGVVSFISPRAPRPLNPPEFPLTRFLLERDSLPIFRNPDIRVLSWSPGLLEPGYRLPLWQPIPAGRQDDLAFTDVPAFYRSPLVREVSPDAPFSVTVVSPRPIDGAWLIVTAGDGPAALRIRVGRRTVERVFPAGETTVLPVEDLRELRSPYQGNRFYEWSARSRFGRARVTLAVDEGVVGMALFNAGRHPEAYRAFTSPRRGPGAGTWRLEQAVAGAASGLLDRAAARELAGDLLAVPAWDGAQVHRHFGIHPDWLDGLPYLSFAGSDLAPEGAGVTTRRIPLEPGLYRVEITGAWRGPITVSWRTPCGGDLFRTEVAPPDGPTPATVPLPVPARFLLGSLRVAPAAGYALPDGMTVTVRPDVVGTVAGRVAQLRRLLGGEGAGVPGPAAYDMVVEGVVPAAGADGEGARAAARFRGGIELLSSRFDTTALRPGGTLGVRLEWRLSDGSVAPGFVWVWVHVVDAAGRMVFYGDHRLAEDLACPIPSGRGVASTTSFPVPGDVPPGEYEVRVGVWEPRHGKNFLVVEPRRERGRNGVTVGRVTVAAVTPGP